MVLRTSLYDYIGFKNLALVAAFFFFLFKSWPAHAVIPTCKALSQCSQTAWPAQGVPLALWFRGFKMLSVFTAHFGTEFFIQTLAVFRKSKSSSWATLMNSKNMIVFS